jgi:hypothetical protein
MNDETDVDEWEITRHSVEVAQSRSAMWLTFAGRALARTREGGPVTWGLVTEAWSCVVALNHVRSCARLAAKTATVPAARQIAEAALDEFDRCVPRLVDARNILEHDEDYVLGMGNLQQSGKRDNRRVDQAAAAAWTYDVAYLDNDRARPVVQIGSDIRIDLSDAVRHAATLRKALHLAARAQGLEPTGVWQDQQLDG